MDMLILASRLFAREYPLPGAGRSVLSLVAALAVILALVAALDFAARDGQSENHDMLSRVSAKSP